MTTLQPSLAPLARRRIALAGPKLRDSCNSCAASKIKCTKEKPTCARCAKRGIACRYFETKRAGRKQGSRQPSNPPVSFPAQVAQHAVSGRTSSDHDLLASPGVLQLSTRPPSVGYPDIFSDAPSLVDPSKTMTTPPTTFDGHFEDFLAASSIPFSVVDIPDASDLPDSYHFNDPAQIGSLLDLDKTTPLLTPDNASSSMETAVFPESRPSSSALPQEILDSRRPSIIGGLDSRPTGSFLGRALNLLKQLPSPASTSHVSRGQGFENHPPTIQSVINDNEQTVQAVSDILEYQSAHDGYLLAILSIIILKVLGWYAAVVRQTPGLDHHPEHGRRSPTMVDNNYCVDDEDQGRMAAQQVLSKLHRIQRVINILSQRFKALRGHGEPPNSSSSSSDSFDIFSNTESLFPFSNSILEQFEVDLRNRLRNLSSETVDILSQG
ncbi:hypothetical protein ASPWEDRAFT_34262 [Aspergillus wentii DTO 134E9]|uniref:Zn(2)-C6 fungal-type domain-containing protein n=1 Tax=Aspergillus wentii DTO 134E9 TaxID=1073089 RepID=A0A1L9S0U4_ASPWE|nr:uncharacterized protein ASPWEDRAFT_34262 [Aspergillus wentii DTO 134E9]KAI9931207.1 hypothetical protein MW887_010868 [Aspergillus wentii]OJJ40786.1 hypothetical protein ASPWEDRAFT_34262 [Aspergillus wentii DTO 134E9]